MRGGQSFHPIAIRFEFQDLETCAPVIKDGPDGNRQLVASMCREFSAESQNEMHILLSKEWEHLYRTTWRPRFAHLPKSERGILVRGCRGKARYGIRLDAQNMLRILQPEGKLRLGVYCCPLCQGFHIVHRRELALYRRMLITGMPDVPLS